MSFLKKNLFRGWKKKKSPQKTRGGKKKEVGRLRFGSLLWIKVGAALQRGSIKGNYNAGGVS